MRLFLFCAVAGLLVLLTPTPASADHLSNTPNWPELLPPDPSVPATIINPGFDACPNGSIECPRNVIAEMYERWRPLNAVCDHRAVFALTYMRTTEEFFRTIQHQPDFFSDPPWVNHEDAVFANFYFRAYDAYKRGDPVPQAWQMTFDAAKSNDLTAVGDLLLGMNAHINRDLPYTLAAVGLKTTDNGSRKLDHDRVNFFLERVADPLQVELALRYDELFRTTDGSPSPFDETGMLATVRGFRENAWRNAEKLVKAATPADRAQVEQSIEDQSAANAEAIIAGNTLPGYGATRDAHCKSSSPDSFSLSLADRRRASILDDGVVGVKVEGDGPSRMRLVVWAKRRGPARKGRRRVPTKLTRGTTVDMAKEGKKRFDLKLRRPARRVIEAGGKIPVRIELRVPGLTVRAPDHIG